MPQTAPAPETHSGPPSSAHAADATTCGSSSAAVIHKGPNAAGRFWLGVLAASVVSLPFCWLLSFAALLPFFIGVFFFALFGLAIGAVVFRVARQAGPYRPSTVVAGTTVLVAFVWFASVLKESWDLPDEMAAKAASKTRDLRGRSVAEFRAVVAADVRRFVQDRYPPGGVVGYARWALATGRIPKGELSSANVELAMNQSRYLFAIRVALSIGLLAFGIASQTWPLRQKLTTSRSGNKVSDP